MLPVTPPVDVARPVDTALRVLTRSANKGRLWLTLATLGVLVGGRHRRAAVRGVAALAATSFVANVVLKPMTRRPRPLIDKTPVVRRLPRAPRTTSFPSGHAASAAAFVTGVALERPVTGVVLAPLAAMVGYSRVHVGVHHVTDVIAGAALGAGVALATRRWLPVRSAEPVPRQDVPAPALPDGEGLLVVVNPRSGSNGDPVPAIQKLLPAAEYLELAPALDLAAELARRADRARAFAAAGGDGTVAAVAAAALRHRLPLAVIPVGTLNHFARDLGVESVADAARAVTVGDGAAVEVAIANDVPFINTAVIGAYPELVRRRDRLAPKVGKWLAMALAAGQVLRRQQPVRLTLNGKPIAVWTLFVGNCRYHPRGPFPAGRLRLDDGWLDLQYLRADTPFSRTRAVLSTLASVSGRSGIYRGELVTKLRVDSNDGPVRIARDGESGESARGYQFAKLPGRLVVYRPAT